MRETRDAYILQSSPGPEWERWTIDEINEGQARVLAAHARTPESLARLAHAQDPPAEAISKVRQVAQIRDLAMEFEGRRDQTWSEEAENFFELAVLEEFLNEGRRGKAGLPSGRPLREGDVFYLEIPRTLRQRPSTRRGEVTPGVGIELLATFRAAAVEVWDLTAAARQSSKVVYHRALEAPAPEDHPRG